MSDDLLISTYRQAISLNLNAHFISLLKLEIYHREIANKLEKISS